MYHKRIQLQVFLLILLCFVLTGGCNRKKPPEPEQIFIEQDEAETAEPLVTGESGGLENTDIEFDDINGQQLHNRTSVQPSFSGLNLSSIGGKINTYELNPVNYENPDIDILKHMGAQQYLISFLEGEQFYRSGNYDKALAEYTASINENRDFTQALISRGNTLLRLGEIVRAIDDYTRAIRLDDNKSEVFNYRGFARAELAQQRSDSAAAKNNMLSLAIDDFTRAISLNADYADALINRSHALYETGEYGRVIEDCNRIIRLEPQNASAWNRRGSAWYQVGDGDKAINDFTQAIRLRGSYALAFYNRGNVWYAKGELDRALADINRALAINPSYANAYSTRANIFHEQGNIESAVADFEAALQNR